MWGGQVRQQTFVAEERAFRFNPATADSAEGERLARILGCNGCHDEEMQGQVMFEQTLFGRLTAPNLTRAVRKYSDIELEQIIRQGIAPGGRGLYVMPSNSFSALRDQDLNNIIEFIRQAPESDNETGPTTFSLMARFFLIKGEFKSQPEEEMYAVTPERNGSEVLIEGDYLTRIKCAECHGRDLKGDSFDGSATPGMVLVKAYSEEEFMKFMRTGLARGDREVGFMSEMSRTHFAYLYDDEIKDLYNFLRDLEP